MTTLLLNIHQATAVVKSAAILAEAGSKALDVWFKTDTDANILAIVHSDGRVTIRHDAVELYDTFDAFKAAYGFINRPRAN